MPVVQLVEGKQVGVNETVSRGTEGKDTAGGEGHHGSKPLGSFGLGDHPRVCAECSSSRQGEGSLSGY